MMKKCNYFRIVASVFLMLLGTINTWAAPVYTDLNMSMLKHWDGVGAKASLVNPDVSADYYNSSCNVGNVQLGKGELVYGHLYDWLYVYADLSEYEGIRIKLTGKSRNVVFRFNRRNGNDSNNGMVEVERLVNLSVNGGVVDLKFSEVPGLKGALYYHLNSIRFKDEKIDEKSTVTLLQAYKSDGYVSPCGNGILTWSGGYTTLTSNGTNSSIINDYSTNFQNVFSWTGSTDNLASITKKQQNISLYDNIVLRTEYTKNGTQTSAYPYRVIIKAIIDNKERTFYYNINADGLISIPLSCALGEGWFEQSNVNGTVVKEEISMDPSMLTNVQILIGGLTANGRLIFYKLALAQSKKNVNWDANSSVSIDYDDFVRDGNFTKTGQEITFGGGSNAWLELAYAYPLANAHCVRIDASVIKSQGNNFIENVIVTNRFYSHRLWATDKVCEFNKNLTKGANTNEPLDGISAIQIKFVGSGTLRLDGFNLTEERGQFDPDRDLVLRIEFDDLEQRDLLEKGFPTEAYKDGEVTEKNLFYNYAAKNEKGEIVNSPGRLMNHPVFGKYYQNLPDANEFTKSKSDNFLRIVLTDGQKKKLDNINYYKLTDGTPNYDSPKPRAERGATIGFWVNAKVAIDYELPLERGSMFCILSNERTLKADAKDPPRYMFDLSCNGWTYSYMPNNHVSPQAENKFTYGETDDVVVGRSPLASLFGSANYEDAQNQLKHMFYKDKDWHYVTYVATDDLKKITVYLDGVKTGELDTRTLSSAIYEDRGDYSGRVSNLRNIVLGGFTPHGLFYGKQYYSDAALAYDDVVIYSRALDQSEIRDIIAAKNYNTSEWLLYQGTSATDRYFQAKNDVELPNYPQAKGIKFKFANNDVVFHADKKLLEMKPGVEYTVTNVPRGYYVRYVSQFDNEQTAGNPPRWPSNFELQGNRTSEVPGEEKFSVTSLRAMGAEYDNYKLVVQDKIWTRAIYVTPYRYANMKYVDRDNGQQKQIVEITPATLSNYANLLPRLSLKIDSDGETDLGNIPDGGTIKYTSSAPQVASVAADGTVTVHGLEGYATITAELVSDNIFDDINGHVDGIKASYEIRVLKENDTYKLASKPEVGDRLATKVDNENITVTAGGLEYNDGRYQTGVDSQTKEAIYNTDEWQVAGIESRANDTNPIDGFEMASQGKLNAMSETYGLGGDWSRGRFDPATSDAPGHNVKPWTLPSRGSYVKIQPKKAGVLSMYILQNGNLGDQKVENQGQPNEKKWCTSVSWRPVYVADETGKIIDDVIVTSTGNISPYDNFFREGRRRAQFIYEKTSTWNEKLAPSMQKMDRERLEYLISYWNNANWKQKVIPSGDGGHMIMSKAMMRYTFNVLPGKTYYIFSNVSKIGISGYNFEEGKHLTKNSSGVYSLTNVSSTSTPITFEDAVNGTSVNGKTYNQPSFPYNKVTEVTYNRTFTPGKWGSICLPFSMNNKQMKENFGDETSVVLLKGIDDDGVVQMVWHVNQDIIAGYPYFILPRGKESITQIKTNAYFDPTVTAPSFVIGPEMDNGQSATYGSIELLEKAVGKTEYPYVFKGNFDTEQATAGSYVMTTNGVLTKASNTPNIKPFRAYLRYCSKIDASSGDHANGKPLSGMGYMNSDGEEVTTSIEQILEANGIFVDSANVYGIDGQVKRYNTHDLNGLPKGIYIVNGKKYVVK